MEEKSDIPQQTRKVAIIGAGPSGLLAAKYCKSHSEVTIFESKSAIGGNWLYTDINEGNHPDLESDDYYKLYKCLHSSMYKDLTANLPKQLMTFKDFLHKEETPTIQTHSQFLEYIKAFAKHFE